MPKTTRDLMKRKLAQAVNHMDKAHEYVTEVLVNFEGYGGDIEKVLTDLLLTFEVSDMLIDKFCSVAWGMDKGKIRLWLQ